MAHRADLWDRLDGADLVVGEHHRHQAGVRPQSCLHLLCCHDAVRGNVQQGDFIALLLQRLEGVEDGVVLELGGDDVLLSLPGTQESGGAEGLVVGLAAAGGEGDLPGVTVQILGKGLTGRRQFLRRPLAGGMETGRVAVYLLKTGHHRGQSRGADSGGGRVIRIDVHGIPPFPIFLL